MEITAFAFRIILLFFPGLLGHVVFNTLTVHKETKASDIIVQSLLLGCASYGLYYYLTHIPCLHLDPTIIVAFSDSAAPLSFSGIASVSGVALIISLIATYADTHKWLYRLANVLKLSTKFGDADVWAYMLNANDVEWIVIRDLEYDTAYLGWVGGFSDSVVSGAMVEVLLREVTVTRSSTGETLGELDRVYLARNREKLLVELPDQ